MKNPSAGEEQTSTTKTDWQEYEREKAKLRELDLPYAEFERRLKEIADRLGI